jgi:hypothetical protein
VPAAAASALGADPAARPGHVFALDPGGSGWATTPDTGTTAALAAPAKPSRPQHAAAKATIHRPIDPSPRLFRVPLAYFP